MLLKAAIAFGYGNSHSKIDKGVEEKGEECSSEVAPDSEDCRSEDRH